MVFDLDGTLVDSYGPITESLNHARAHFGFAPLAEDVVRKMVGHGLEDLMRQNLGADRVEAGVALFRSRYEKVFLAGTRPLAGVPDVPLALAAQGWRLGVASNKPARFGQRIIEKVGLSGAITVVLGPDCGVPPKPAPPMLQLAMEKLGVNPEETVYVGDMPLDAETGRQAGVRKTILLPTGSAGPDELQKIPNVLIVNDLYNFVKALQAC